MGDANLMDEAAGLQGVWHLELQLAQRVSSVSRPWRRLGEPRLSSGTSDRPVRAGRDRVIIMGPRRKWARTESSVEGRTGCM